MAVCLMYAVRCYQCWSMHHEVVTHTLTLGFGEYLVEHRELVQGKNVLELGAGVGN